MSEAELFGKDELQEITIYGKVYTAHGMNKRVSVFPSHRFSSFLVVLRMIVSTTPLAR